MKEIGSLIRYYIISIVLQVATLRSGSIAPFVSINKSRPAAVAFN
jgi:hypothetical protein